MISYLQFKQAAEQCVLHGSDEPRVKLRCEYLLSTSLLRHYNHRIQVKQNETWSRAERLRHTIAMVCCTATPTQVKLP